MLTTGALSDATCSFTVMQNWYQTRSNNSQDFNSLECLHKTNFRIIFLKLLQDQHQNRVRTVPNFCQRRKECTKGSISKEIHTGSNDYRTLYASRPKMFLLDDFMFSFLAFENTKSIYFRKNFGESMMTLFLLTFFVIVCLNFCQRIPKSEISLHADRCTRKSLKLLTIFRNAKRLISIISSNIFFNPILHAWL